MADNYKHENGKATIFKNKYKDTESKPNELNSALRSKDFPEILKNFNTAPASIVSIRSNSR